MHAFQLRSLLIAPPREGPKRNFRCIIRLHPHLAPGSVTTDVTVSHTL